MNRLPSACAINPLTASGTLLTLVLAFIGETEHLIISSQNPISCERGFLLAFMTPSRDSLTRRLITESGDSPANHSPLAIDRLVDCIAVSLRMTLDSGEEMALVCHRLPPRSVC